MRDLVFVDLLEYPILGMQRLFSKMRIGALLVLIGFAGTTVASFLPCRCSVPSEAEASMTCHASQPPESKPETPPDGCGDCGHACHLKQAAVSPLREDMNQVATASKVMSLPSLGSDLSGILFVAESAGRHVGPSPPGTGPTNFSLQTILRL